MVFQKLSRNEPVILKEDTLEAKIGNSTLILILRLISQSGKYILKSRVLVAYKDKDLPTVIQLMNIGSKVREFQSKEEALKEYDELITMWKLQSL